MESNTTTHEFLTSNTRRGHTRHVAYHVEIESGVELPKRCTKDRWYQVLAPFITKVERWSVQADVHTVGSTHNWAEKAKIVYPSRTYVVHTKFGTATIVEFEGDSAICGITYKNGRKMKTATLNTWRKYGQKRGHGMPQLLAACGMGLCTTPNSGRDVCEWEAVCRLTQPGYEAADHKATTALYDAAKAA